MQGPQTQLFSPEDEIPTTEMPFRLDQLEVFNWGPFRGLHRVEFDPVATAIIGPTGSGKTTLVDALMTLLVGLPKYNLASTGGHESDRTLASYVRGVLGGDGSDGREEVARPGKTMTGICATYYSGSESLKLASLLWFEGTSSAADDLKKRWIFSQAPDQSLETWLSQLHSGGPRELMKSGRETANLRIFEPKNQYLAYIRKFFDVGENAFTLLNRAAGLKQLNSIDEIFRELVLDDRSAFSRALEVATEFDNLAEIHKELETARRQVESLKPIEQEHQVLLRAQESLEKLKRLKEILPVWFAIVAQQKWADVMVTLGEELKQLQSQILSLGKEEGDCQSRVEMLRERYLQLGGNVISELQEKIDLQQERANVKRKNATDYRRMVATFQLSDELSSDVLLCNQVLLRQKKEELCLQRIDLDKKVFSSHSRLREQEESVKKLATALQKTRARPGSNIPLDFQDFRKDLALQVGLSEDDLPFLAELVEIKSEQSAWRGAIERAIGSERLRILVPEDHINAALHWVNHRENRLHVRLQLARKHEQSVHFFQDSFTRKLNFKSHPLHQSAQKLLSGRDLHCVTSTKALKSTEHALTIEGMISWKGGKYDKQDQRRLDENWMTGFDNKDQLRELIRQREAAQTEVAKWKSQFERHHQALSQLDHQLNMINSIIEIKFSEIDQPGAESDLASSRQRLEKLLDPKSDASQAKQLFEKEKSNLDSIGERLRELQRTEAGLNSNLTRAEREHDKAYDRMKDGLTDEDRRLAETTLTVPPDVAAEDLNDEERKVNREVEGMVSQTTGDVTDIEKKLVQKMGRAKHEDTGALSDVGTEIDDIPRYLDQLRVLKEEALPEKQTRFRAYLNSSSDQGVTQLLAGINEEVDIIEQRIQELNRTLVKVDFRNGRYLQLQPQRLQHERLRTLDTAMRKVRSAALMDDEGESHYSALRDLVEILRDAGTNYRNSASRALLDPRYRLQFFVVEVDRQSRNPSPQRTGSQGGSGGEKELMASHILTASLSYALCPAGANRPLYSTVVLDEAFSKSSPSAASRIIEALRIFGLHPIFVTPNKEIGLLKRHTRKVICVQRPAKESSLASISWEKLEELARPQ